MTELSPQGGQMRIRYLVAAAAAALTIGVAGCGGSSSAGGGQTAAPVDPNAAEVSPAGDIPDNQAFVGFRPPGARFTVKVPEGWARTAASGTVEFSDKLNAITLEQQPATSAPSAAEAKRAELPKLANSVKGFRAARVTTVERTAGKALRITYLADSKADPVTGKTGTDAVERYLFFRNGKLAVLTLSGPKGADNVDTWMIVTDSLRWTR